MKLFCDCVKDAGLKQTHVPTAIGNERGKKPQRRQNRVASAAEAARKEGDDKTTASLSLVEEAKFPDHGLKENEAAGDIVRASKSWNIPLDIKKTDPEHRLIFGWASVVEKDGKPIIDKQLDIIPVEELENAAYEFTLNSRNGGDMHSRNNLARLVESMVFTKDKQKALGIDLGQVGWWVGFKVHDDELWAAHKRGERPEFSIGGAAIPIDVDDNIFKRQGVRRHTRLPFDSGAAGAVYHAVHRLLVNQRHNLIHEYTNHSVVKSVDKIVSILEADDIILKNTVRSLTDGLTRASQRSATDAISKIAGNPEHSMELINNVDEWSRNYGKDRSAEIVGRKYNDVGNLVVDPGANWNINKTTNETATDIVTEALRHNRNVAEFETLLDKASLFSAKRAKTIADTEINTVQNFAMLRVGFEFNNRVRKARSREKLMKLWSCGPNPCVICQENCDEVINLEDTFPSGDFAPSVHPNCMCEVELILI